MFYWIIIIIIIIIRELNISVLYLWRDLEQIDKFILVLLEEGYDGEGINNNSSIYLTLRKNVEIGIIKYNEKGKCGLYLIIPKENFETVQKEIIENELKNLNLDYFQKAILNLEFVIDFKTNIKMLKSFLKFLSNRVLSNSEHIFLSSFEKFYIKTQIPILRYQWLLWKIKNPGKKV
jgi:hypothetical protein